MSNANWYARKLGQPQRPSETPTQLPPQVPVNYQPNLPNVPVTYDPRQDQLVTRASSARQNESCPECMSVNYMSPPGSNAAKRCYDCGYPLMQSGSGVIATGGGGGGGKATPAKQPAMGSGFNPHIIVDRIS